jgi:hypothetical protein
MKLSRLTASGEIMTLGEKEVSPSCPTIQGDCPRDVSKTKWFGVGPKTAGDEFFHKGRLEIPKHCIGGCEIGADCIRSNPDIVIEDVAGRIVRLCMPHLLWNPEICRWGHGSENVSVKEVEVCPKPNIPRIGAGNDLEDRMKSVELTCKRSRVSVEIQGLGRRKNLNGRGCRTDCPNVLFRDRGRVR